MAALKFPHDFTWGTATASYQIEGAVHEDGRGESIWDTFSRTPGKVKNGDTGDIADDHYHRYPEDIQLMKNLNISAYRLSIAWPRIYPQGRGSLNELGLDFYSRVVDDVLEAGITPYVTLYHWDLPQTLQDEGGWMRRGIVDDYVNYVDTVTRALGDRVKNWITFNEPWVFTWLGYVIGVHAPGLTSTNPAPAFTTSHHCYVAHGMAVPVIRQNSSGAKVGITLNLSPADSASPKDRRSRSDGDLRRLVQPLVSRPALSQELSGGHRCALQRVHARDSAGGHGNHCRAARLPGRQLLLARRDRGWPRPGTALSRTCVLKANIRRWTGKSIRARSTTC